MASIDPTGGTTASDRNKFTIRPDRKNQIRGLGFDSVRALLFDSPETVNVNVRHFVNTSQSIDPVAALNHS
jgi:hypothetical protein